MGIISERIIRMNRREFIKSVGVVTAAIGLGGLLQDINTTEETNIPKYPKPLYKGSLQFIGGGSFQIPKGQPISEFFNEIYGKGPKVIYHSVIFTNENFFDLWGDITLVENYLIATEHELVKGE